MTERDPVDVPLTNAQRLVEQAAEQLDLAVARSEADILFDKPTYVWNGTKRSLLKNMRSRTYALSREIARKREEYLHASR